MIKTRSIFTTFKTASKSTDVKDVEHLSKIKFARLFLLVVSGIDQWYRPMPGIDQCQVSTNARYRPMPGIDQCQVSTNARYRPMPGIDQCQVSINVTYRPIASGGEGRGVVFHPRLVLYQVCHNSTIQLYAVLLFVCSCLLTGAWAAADVSATGNGRYIISYRIVSQMKRSVYRSSEHRHCSLFPRKL